MLEIMLCWKLHVSGLQSVSSDLIEKLEKYVIPVLTYAAMV